MENIDNINNDGIKPKRVYSAAQIKAVKAFHERHRNSEEYKRVNCSAIYDAIMSSLKVMYDLIFMCCARGPGKGQPP